MIHILLIDPLEKLVIKKDSTLLLALTLKELGHEAWVMFEKDLHVCNKTRTTLTVHSFEGEYSEEDFKLSRFELGESRELPLEDKGFIHMRLDPPFDTRYQRVLWMLDYIQEATDFTVINNPRGIMAFNEKLTAFKHPSSLDTYLGADRESLEPFLRRLAGEGVEHVILKPLDLYQGIGVEKISLSDREKVLDLFQTRVADFGGAILIQPYAKSVETGEVRTFFFKGKELGSIVKIPPEGAFLANIAQGARYEKTGLTDAQRKACEEICRELMNHDVPWVAFDILGDAVSEVNVTCPGLLVELSHAMGKNLAGVMEKMF